MPGKSKLFALLIGIDRYSQTPLDDGSYYPHLGGCVRDINLVEQMLRSRLGLDDQQITKLESGNAKKGKKKNGTLLPTYKNLITAFKDVTAKAAAGDQVYIHYSGHGGRTLTMFEELKGARGLDESLVPCDIGENGPCFLRDIEIAYLLKEMSDKGLLVTMVLDSCHSGGATRGTGGAVVRGTENIYMGTPPAESFVAPKDKLLTSFRELPQHTTRNVNAGSGWSIPKPRNFVLLAACRANELANEYAFDGNERNGALTYWMLDALRQYGEGYTYRMLHNRIVAKVHAKFVDQTPQLEGDGDREIFGTGQLRSFASVNVVKVDSQKKRVKLNTGLSQGIADGAQFALYAANAADVSDQKQRLAVVEAVDTGATETWAKIVTETDPDKIQDGSQAVLLGLGIRMRGRIRLVKQETSASETPALAELRSAIEGAKQDGQWIRLAGDDEEADLQVAVNTLGEYEIWDANGRTLPNLRPALKTGDTDATATLAQRLVHLTKFRNARLIDNTDPTSPLALKVVAEFGKWKTGKDATRTFQPFGANPRPLSAGEEFCLRVTNNSKKDVNIAILDLQPDWGISQIYPTERDYELLAAGANNAYTLDAAAALPEDYQEGTDTLKVFATVEGTSFRWLEMPALDQPLPSTKDLTRAPGDALEELMAAFAGPNLTRQIVNLSAPKGRSWAAAAIEVRIRRGSIAHVHDPALSLLQSAFDQTIATTGKTKTRTVNGAEVEVARPELSDPIINEVTQYCVALVQGEVTDAELISFNEEALNNAQKRGAIDVAKYCASMAAGVAREWFRAKIWGDETRYNQYKAALTQKFGDCDPSYRAAMQQFVEFLRKSGHVPYRANVRPDDFVFEDRLPPNAVVGIVADWATGEPEALEVLRQVKGHKPDAAVHLGDIYYAGTEHEVENYFYQPWTKILGPQVTSFALPGNHDLYAGGKPFYDMIDKLALFNGIEQKMASYFCLRNDHWQLIGLDTALHDRLIGGPTKLEESELEWLKDKISGADGRRTVLMSHHQLFSANDRFDGKSYNNVLFDQLKDMLPSVDLWLWGHEHDLVIFDPYIGLNRGRCIGGSAFPVGNFEMPVTQVNPEVTFNKQVALSKGNAFYQHCYTMLRLNGSIAIVSYYEDSSGGRLLFEETI